MSLIVDFLLYLEKLWLMSGSDRNILIYHSECDFKHYPKFLKAMLSTGIKTNTCILP